MRPDLARLGQGHASAAQGDLFLTDGGIETSLIYHQGLELLAAFVLLENEEGKDALRRYFQPYLELARDNEAGFILESPTWRANPRWAGELGYSSEQLDAINRSAIELMQELRAGHDGSGPVLISGCIGPQDDGYNPGMTLDAEAARAYHSEQIATFADSGADLVGDHHDLRRRGHRRGARGPRCRHPVGDLVHRRDRRPAAERGARRGDRPGRRGDQLRARVPT